jgi:DUF971 family protein
MTEESISAPRQLTLHKKSRTLEVEFATGERFILPCEYLRVFSPSADKKISDHKNVNILAIEPVGNYAVKFIFSDGHRTGIYSWQTLYTLGVNQQKNWQNFLEK